MRKRVLLALVLVLALVMSTSCSLIVKDEAVDLATPVIEVAGKTFTKGEVKEQAEAYLDYNEYMYSYYYGMPYDRNSDSAKAEAQEQAIQGLIESAVVDAKLAEFGFDALTAEEQAEIETTAKEDYDLYYETIQNFFFTDSELTGDELTAAIEAEMANMGYPNYEALVEEYTYSKQQEKLIAEINKDVALSEEELTTEYAARVEESKSAYESYPASYGPAVTNGENPYYAPAGYRNVKHILLVFGAEDETAIADAEAALAALAEGEDATALQADLNAAKETAYANLQPTIDEITAKLAEGADFNALITEYNQDPGMTAESAGYPVCAESTEWVTEFKDASMALANVGDISEPVRSSYGIHLIQYAGDIAEGEIGLETVRESLSAELLAAKESANVETVLAQWVEEAAAKVDEKALNN